MDNEQHAATSTDILQTIREIFKEPPPAPPPAWHTYSSYPDCPVDALRFLVLWFEDKDAWHGHFNFSRTIGDGAQPPNMTLEFQTTLGLDAVHALIDRVPDGYLMGDTLRPVSLAQREEEEQQQRLAGKAAVPDAVTA